MLMMDGDDSIAIVGLGCRFPGANDIDEFWKILINGENHVKDIPKERWNIDAFYDPDPDAPGKTYVKKAGLLSDYDAWDNHFFGISDTEASQVDPQQRLVLECVHMALENGGITKQDIDGSRTGVYIGAMNDDFRGSSSFGDNTRLDNYTLTGHSPSIISARVSYVYNLLGPAMTIDTACSSALVAINSACLSLKSGESDMAICGGVNSILYPEMFIPLSKARMASPSGKCQAFSANADGYARGEGCGIVILKKLKRAIDDGDNIWATIVTGCNQDGRTANPITAPSSTQQEELLQMVYSDNKIDPNEVQYIEAHGTGTPIGDPTEVNSLGRFFNTFSQSIDNELKVMKYIGSVKTNIGHTESAAGVAGLIKVLLMMKNELIVPSLHADELNPKIDFQEFRFMVPKKVSDWIKSKESQMLACINCFGFGGTNSHAVVKQFSMYNDKYKLKNLKTVGKSERKPENSNESCIIAVSAADTVALKRSTKKLIEMANQQAFKLDNLSYTLLCRKDHYGFRFAFVSNSVENVIQEMNNYVNQPDSVKPRDLSSVRLIFVFCGVGTSWLGMCNNLISKYPVFKKTLHDIDQHLFKKTGWCISSKLAYFTDVTDPFVCHIAIFACQVGLAALWKHWGIEPDSIVGQSVGEVAAALISGSLSLEDAVTVIYERSKVLRKTKSGTMAVVTNSDLDQIEKVISNEDGVSIAVYNSQRSCTLSGDPDSLNKVCEQLHAKSAGNIHKLNVPCAYHSRFVEHSSEELPQLLEHITRQSSKVPVFSSVTGIEADATFASSMYWKDNVRKPVLFSKAIKQAAKESTLNIYLEIGPKPVLLSHYRDILPNFEVVVLPSIKPNLEVESLQSTLARLYQNGIDPVWKNVLPENIQTSFLQLPSYSFTRKQNLQQSDVRLKLSHGIEDKGHTHLFLQRHSTHNNAFTAYFRPTDTRFVFEHKVDNQMVLPGAVYGEMAMELSRTLFDCPLRFTKTMFRISNPVVLQENKTCQLLLNIEKQSENEIHFRVKREDNIKTLVADGCVSRITTSHKQSTFDLARLDHFVEELPVSELYNQLEKLGFTYGENLRHFISLKMADKELLAEIKLSDTTFGELRNTNLHPVVIDLVLQSVSPLLSELLLSAENRMFPVGISGIHLHQSPEKEMLCFTKLVSIQANQILIDSVLSSKDGIVIAEFKNIEYKFLDDSKQISAFRYNICWEEILAPIVQGTDSIEEVHLISCDKRMLQIIADVLSGHVQHTLCLQKKEDSIDSVEEKIKQVVESSSEKIGIVFAPGLKYLETDTSAEEIYSTVAYTCHVCLKIVQAIGLKNIPLAVITEGTQSLSETDSVKHNVNLFGSELWGMVRSVLAEPRHTDILLVDICPELRKENTLLKTTLEGFFKNHTIFDPEILMREEKVYVNVLKRMHDKQTINIYRENIYDTKCSVSVMSEKHSSVSKPYLTMNSTDAIEPKNASHLQRLVQIKEFVLHSASLYPVTDTERQTNSFLQLNDNNHQLLAIEGGGYVVEKNQKSTFFPLSSKIFPLESSLATDVAFCYPVKVTSEVIVPESCIIRLDKLPGYFPGSLLSAYISWHIISYVPDNVSVCIVHEVEQETLPNMLKKYLHQDKNCHVQTLQSNEVQNFGTFEEHTLIVIGKCPLAIMVPKIQRLQNIIGLRYLISLQNISDLRKDGIRASVHLVETEQILDIVYLEKTFPKFKKWLFKNWQRIRSANTRQNPSHMEKCTIQISNPMEEESFERPNKVRVTKEQLFRKTGCYIIVGGLTGLGWEILKLLCIKGAGHVVSLSRRAASSVIKQQIDNLVSLCDVKIHVLQADVCDLDTLKSTFLEIEKLLKGVPIKGIFQGAGVLEDALFKDMTVEQFDVALRPKVLGTWNLHVVSLKYPIDYFVMHSSVASVLGNIKQSNYAAGNCFLDALAHYRRLINLPGQTINWGALDLGMANDPSVKAYLQDIGFSILDVENIKTCFLEALLLNNVQIIYSVFDWERISENLSVKNTSLRYRVAELIGNDRSQNSVVSTEKIDTLKFHKMAEDDKYSEMSILVRNVTAGILCTNPDAIKNDSTMMSLGMDSHKILECMNVLHDKTGCRVPYVYMTSDEFIIGALVTYLIQQISNGNKTENSSNSRNDSLTHMEHFWHSKYLKDPTDPSIVAVLQFKISASLCIPEVWQKVLQNTLAVHPELRTLYRIHYTGDVIKTILLPEDVIIDFRYGHSNSEDEFPSYTMNPSKDLPIRVLLTASSKGGSISFLFNSMATDLFGASQLVEEIYSSVASCVAKNELPKLPKKRQINLARTLDTSLQSQIEKLQDFWMQELDTPFDTITLAKSRVEINTLWNNQTSFVELTISEKDLKKLEAFLLKFGSDKFKLFTSLYQLGLHLRCKANVVAVLTKTDIRKHIPELVDRLYNGSNFIPILSKMSPDQTITEFLSTNKEKIGQCHANGLYPFNMIMENSKINQSILRHEVSEENLSHFRNVSVDNKYWMKPMKILNGDTQIETSLILSSNGPICNFKLKLRFNENIIQHQEAQGMLGDIYRLMNICMELPTAKLGSLWIHLENDILPHEIETDRQLQLSKWTAPFLKQTSDGWDHLVNVSLRKVKGIGHCLVWGENQKEDRKLLPLNLIDNVTTKHVNGLQALCLVTSKRGFVFKSADINMVEGWFEKLRQQVNRNKEECQIIAVS